MARITQNAVKNQDGTIVAIAADADSVTSFLADFNALPLKARSGYDKYYNDNGPTNPESPRKLSPLGIGKMLAVMLEKAHETIARGGAKSEQMKDILAGVLAYNDIAPGVVAKNAEIAAEKAALAAELAAKNAAEGLAAVPEVETPEAVDEVAVPPAAVTADEADAASEPSDLVDEAVETLEQAQAAAIEGDTAAAAELTEAADELLNAAAAAEVDAETEVEPTAEVTEDSEADAAPVAVDENQTVNQ